MSVSLVDVARALRRRDAELRNDVQSLLAWDRLTRVDQQRWVEMAVCAWKLLREDESQAA